MNYTDPIGFAQFDNAEELIKIATLAMNNNSFKPRKGMTFCNKGVNYIEQAGGNYDYDSLLANNIMSKLRDPKYATEITAKEAVEYAKNGTTVIAGISEDGHGHVAIVSPRPMANNKEWGDMPYVFNIGKINGELTINQVFRKTNKPKYYLRNEDM